MAPKKKAAVQVVETAPPMATYRRLPRYEWVEYDPVKDGGIDPADIPADHEPLRCRILTNLTFGEMEAIPYGLNVRWPDVLAAIAPFVVAWNQGRVNPETGEAEVLPPPAEAGPDALNALSDDEALWLLLAIKFRYRQRDGMDQAEAMQAEAAEMGKDSTTSELTASP